MDTDSVHVKNFTPLFQKSFVTYRNDEEFKNICNCIFGLAPGSNFIKFSLESLKKNYESLKGFKDLYTPYRTGPTFFTTMFVSYRCH